MMIQGDQNKSTSSIFLVAWSIFANIHISCIHKSKISSRNARFESESHSKSNQKKIRKSMMLPKLLYNFRLCFGHLDIMLQTNMSRVTKIGGTIHYPTVTRPLPTWAPPHCYLTATKPLSDHYPTATWPLPNQYLTATNCYLTSTQWLPDGYTTATRQLPDGYMMATQLLPNH